jgi:hypothetical protein
MPLSTIFQISVTGILLWSVLYMYVEETTDHQDIIEILLKVALDTMTLTPQFKLLQLLR